MFFSRAISQREVTRRPAISDILAVHAARSIVIVSEVEQRPRSAAIIIVPRSKPRIDSIRQ
jgi:hypothetical protein